MGAVMVIAGLAGVILGKGTVPDAGAVTPNIDSEIRFFAAWYAGAGILLLTSLRHLESARPIVLFVAGAFFLAGCARLLSWAAVGRPHWSQLALMAVELVLPFVIVPWHRAATRGR